MQKSAQVQRKGSKWKQLNIKCSRAPFIRSGKKVQFKFMTFQQMHRSMSHLLLFIKYINNVQYNRHVFCTVCVSAFRDRWTYPPIQTHSHFHSHSHPHKPTPTHTDTPPPLFLNLLVRLWNLLGWLPGDCCLLLEYWSYPSPPAPFLSFHLSMGSFHPFNLEVLNNRRMRAGRKHAHCSYQAPIKAVWKFEFIYLPHNKLHLKRSWDSLAVEIWYTSVDPSWICCNPATTISHEIQHPHNSHISVSDQTPTE